MTPATPSLAVLFAPPDAGAGARMLVGGLSVLERQRRLARAAGAGRIVVIGAPSVPLARDAATFVAADAGALASLIVTEGPVLVLAPGLVVDLAAILAVTAAAPPAIGIWPAHGARAGVERIDAHSVAGGIAVYPAAMVRAVADGLGDWDLQSTLLRTALTDGGVRVDLDALPAPGWMLVADEDSAQAATATLVDAAARPGRGWPARLLFPPLETVAVRLLLPVAVPPRVADAVVAGLAVLAGVAFAAGWLAVGLVLALLCAPLAGIAARLARVRLEPRTPPAHWIGAALDLGWSAAVVVGIAARSGGIGPWALGALLIGFGLAEHRQRRFFRRLTGGDLDAAGAVERRFSLVAARRDVLLWTWLPLAAVGLWPAWLGALAIHAAVSFFVVQARSFARIAAGSRKPAAESLSVR